VEKEGVTDTGTHHPTWLWGVISAAGRQPEGTLYGQSQAISLATLGQASSLGGRLEDLRGRTVLLGVRDQLSAALALLELDGVARRLVLCPPDLPGEHLQHVVTTAGADAWVGDETGAPQGLAAAFAVSVQLRPQLSAGLRERRQSHETEWVLLTSGTSGAPKLVLHTLATLTSMLRRRPAARGSALWSTFYDIRRYGGLQIFLRSMHIGSLVLSAAGEPVAEFLARARTAGVTHISGTPSHWRRMLMSGAAATLEPRYVRLSGEIADQSVLDSLRAVYPQAAIAHAFASSEAGVAFEVGDGTAGFPADLLGSGGDIELRVAEGTLQIRSAGNALRYLDADAPPLRRTDGFVDTGDRVELRAGRYHFVGRTGGVINVGGLKVHPEEIEAVINSHPWVRMSLARSRPNPITGAVVAADVVLAEPSGERPERPPPEMLKRELLDTCKRALPAHKVPAIIRIVPALQMSESGKLVRPNA
jgi:acyl-coenzyme A synthetase/AMP-(fatty) acid ligase